MKRLQQKDRKEKISEGKRQMILKSNGLLQFGENDSAFDNLFWPTTRACKFFSISLDID